MDVPLIDFNKMNLYRIIPFPTLNLIHNESVSAYILPENEYIAISQERRTYLAPSTEKVHQCRVVDNTKICSNFPPLLHVTNNSRCEVNILCNLNFNAHECNIKIKNLFETYFINLDE